MAGPALLTPDQVAEMLGVRRARVLALVRGGAIGVVRLGPRTVRFRPSDVEAFIDRQARPAIEERHDRQRAAGADRSPQPASGRAAPTRRRRRTRRPVHDEVDEHGLSPFMDHPVPLRRMP